ncbi:hypothetical protein EWT43_26750 [Escherichia coli O25b:H4]|nr:hypothetical protein EWT43_26750 [Escherichia coli O25b:H4]
MLNALCSRVLQVRFIYAGYTPAIRDSPVGTRNLLLLRSHAHDRTHSVYFTYMNSCIDLMCLISLIYL